MPVAGSVLRTYTPNKLHKTESGARKGTAFFVKRRSVSLSLRSVKAHLYFCGVSFRMRTMRKRQREGFLMKRMHLA